MIGYDTHGPQYPQEWNEQEQEEHLYHWMIDEDTECDGEMHSFYSRTEGNAIRTTYYCSECGREYTDDHVVHEMERREEAKEMFGSAFPELEEAVKNLSKLEVR